MQMAKNQGRKYMFLLFISFLSVILLAGCGTCNRPSRADAQKYLGKYLDEPYQIISETHDDEEDVYELYLPDSDIIVHLTCSYKYNDAVHRHWIFDIDDYYETKYLSHTDARKKLRKEKYTSIHEKITFSNYSREDNESISTIDISIDSEDNLHELYDYLIDCYNLNDFRYYNAYSMENSKLTSLYWQDYISIRLFCSDKQIMHLYFGDLRKSLNCLPEHLNEMISYEEFKSKIMR